MSEQTLLLKNENKTAHEYRAGDLEIQFRLSRYDAHDYEGAVAIENAYYPEFPQDANSWRYWDANREAKYLWRRYVAELDGEMIATAELGHTSWSYQPGKFFIYIGVNPHYQQQGIGSAFYDYLMGELMPLEPTKLVSKAREDHQQSFRFLQRRGFRSMLRMPCSRLQVAAFRPEPFQSKVDRVLQSGIVVKTMAELSAEDPDWKRKVYELEWECVQDVPTTDPLTKRTFETFESAILHHPRLLKDAWFIAVDGERYVGLSVLWRNPAKKELLETGLTGVVRSHRRRGIATAMKLRAIEYAQSYGATELITDNEENNPMFQINLRLGFEPMPAFHEFQKELTPAV